MTIMTGDLSLETFNVAPFPCFPGFVEILLMVQKSCKKTFFPGPPSQPSPFQPGPLLFGTVPWESYVHV